MLESTYYESSDLHKVLYEQVAVNDGFKYLLSKEKELMEKQILSMRRGVNDDELVFLRCLEKAYQKLDILNEWIQLNENIISTNLRNLS